MFNNLKFIYIVIFSVLLLSSDIEYNSNILNKVRNVLSTYCVPNITLSTKITY